MTIIEAMIEYNQEYLNEMIPYMKDVLANRRDYMHSDQQVKYYLEEIHNKIAEQRRLKNRPQRYY